MDANPGDVTAITLPEWCRRVFLYMLQSDGTTLIGGRAAPSSRPADVRPPE